MERGRPYRASTEKKSEGDSDGSRRFTSVPRSVLTGAEQPADTKRAPEAFRGSVAQLFVRSEMPGQLSAAELSHIEAETKKKRKKKKKGQATAVEPSEELLVPVIEIAKGSDEKEDEDGEDDDEEEPTDDYQPVEIKLEKPEGADYGGEVIYLHNYVRPKGESKDNDSKPAEASKIDEPEHADSEATPLADVLQLHRQPEQQMQSEALSEDELEPGPASEQYVTGPEPTAAHPAAEFVSNVSPGGAGGGGEVPPPGSGGDGGGEEPPEFSSAGDRIPQAASQEWDPGRIYREYAARDAEVRETSYGAVSPSEQVVPKREYDDAVYRAEKIGQNRGVAAGLVAGWWLGRRFLRKKMTREFAATTKEQDKKVQQTETALHFSQEDQDKQRAELARQRAELNRYQGTSQQYTERYPVAPERREPAQQQAPQRGEQVQAPLNQIVLEQQPEDQLTIPPEHVMQSSAWHNIEIDAHTGRPVEAPSFQYGEEYHKERARETMPVNQQSTVAGEVASAAATAAGSPTTTNGDGTDSASAANLSRSSNQPGAPVLPPTNIPSATTQGPPTPQTKRSSAGPIWPYLVALVIIVLCLAWLLH